MNQRTAGLVAELFAGDPSNDAPSVGIELELFPLRPSGDGKPPTVSTIAATAEALEDVPFITFEPGGQVELNPPPASTAGEAVERIGFLRAEVAGRLRERDLDLVAIGLDPWHDAAEVPLQLADDRYRAMDAHYAAIGPEGRTFMRQTASTQICVGLRPGDDGWMQWHAANLVAPLLAAIFANAPFRHGRPLGHNGGRTAVIEQADRARHRLDWVARAPHIAYAELACAANPIGGAYAGPGHAAAHLTTLFPPVRPRGTYLELRSVDALDVDDLATAVALTAALLASPRACRELRARVPVSPAVDRARWARAADVGIRDPAIGADAAILVEIAGRAAQRDLPTGYLPADAAERLDGLRSKVLAGRAPGDGLDVDHLRAPGAVPTDVGCLVR